MRTLGTGSVSTSRPRCLSPGPRRMFEPCSGPHRPRSIPANSQLRATSRMRQRRRSTSPCVRTRLHASHSPCSACIQRRAGQRTWLRRSTGRLASTGGRPRPAIGTCAVSTPSATRSSSATATRSTTRSDWPQKGSTTPGDCSCKSRAVPDSAHFSSSVISQSYLRRRSCFSPSTARGSRAAR